MVFRAKCRKNICAPEYKAGIEDDFRDLNPARRPFDNAPELPNYVV